VKKNNKLKQRKISHFYSFHFSKAMWTKWWKFTIFIRRNDFYCKVFLPAIFTKIHI